MLAETKPSPRLHVARQAFGLNCQTSKVSRLALIQRWSNVYPTPAVLDRAMLSREGPPVLAEHGASTVYRGDPNSIDAKKPTDHLEDRHTLLVQQFTILMMEMIPNLS